MATKNICTYPMEQELAKNANAIIEQGGKLKRVNLDYEFDKKADGIVCEEEGKIILVKDSAKARPKNLILCGKSTQKTTKGNQLINFSDIKSVNATNIEITENGRKVEIIGSNSYARCEVTINVSNMIGETVYLTGNVTGGKSAGFSPYKINSSGEKTWVSSTTFQDGYTIESDIVEIQLMMLANNTSENLDEEVTAVFENIMLSTKKDATWEEYSGGQPSPNPDYPQEIVNVENPEIYVYGKNLLKNIAKSGTSNGITFTVNDDRSVTVNGTATAGAWLNLTGKLLLPAGTYILSGCPKGGIYASTYVLSCDYVADYGNSIKTFTLDKPTSITVNIGIYSGYTADNLKFYPMIRCVECVDDTYEQYKEKQTIPLTHTFPGIPVTTGGNYTDADGQQWICDEIDLERGMYVQRCFTETLKFTPQTELNRYTATLTHTANYNCADGNGIPVLCKEYVFDPLSGSGTPMVNGIRIASTSPKYAIAYHNGEVIESATVMYPLAEPIETPLTDAEIYAFKNLEMNFPNTTIFNDADAHMKLDYFADTLRFLVKSGGGLWTLSKFEMNLPVSGWTLSSDNSHYYQVVTVKDSTHETMINLQPTAAQYISLINSGTVMFASNESGIIKVCAVGSKPTTDMTIQATKMEVVYV